MKRLLLAAAALGFAGTIGTANAAPVGPPDISITVDMWNLANTVPGGHNNSLDAVQQALPTARGAIVTAGGTHFGAVAYAQPINYNLNPGGDVAASINQFFAADVGGSGLPPSSCTAACATLTGSAPGFASVTLFEFTFSTPGESFTVQHDDGVSLFNALDTTFATNLLPPGASAPTNSAMEGPVNLAAGTYDLFFTSANGTPEVLQTGTVVPAPLIGHGLLVLLAVGGVLFGGKLLERSKARGSLGAA